MVARTGRKPQGHAPSRRAITARVGLASIVVAAGVGCAAAIGGPVAALGVGTAAFLVVALAWVDRPGSLPFWAVLALGAFVFSSILPVALSFAVQAGILAGSFLLWFAGSPRERRGNRVVPWAVAITAFWLLLVFHPNVPGLQLGLEGFRKTVFAVSGVVFGCAIHAAYRVAVERALIGLLTAALGLSVVAHYWFPGLTRLVQREADVYTAVFGGQARLEGTFAGPFHVALAGVVLVGWALVRYSEHRRWAVVVGAVGLFATYLSLVRTAYVAVVLVGIAVILGRRGHQFARRARVALVALALLGTLVLLAGGPLADSVDQVSSDGRFINRFPGYLEGLRLLVDSPVYGWGAGSAGDTLGGAFRAGEYVTAHNLVLKIAVEGGLVGLFLFGGFLVAAWRHLDRRQGSALVAISGAVALLAMGITGSAIETLPVSWIVFVFIGLAIREGEPPRAGVNVGEGSGADRSATRRDPAGRRGAPGESGGPGDGGAHALHGWPRTGVGFLRADVVPVTSDAVRETAGLRSRTAHFSPNTPIEGARPWT